MTILSKNFIINIVAGRAGTQGEPGRPPTHTRLITGTRTIKKPNTSVYHSGATPGIDHSRGAIVVVQPDSNGIRGTFAIGYTKGVQKFVYETESYMELVPGEPGVRPIPARPPTPTRISKIANKGWNVSARSGVALSPDNYIEITVSDGSQGIFVGIGREGKDNQSINSFSHSLIVDRGSVKVFEKGENIKTLIPSQVATNRIRIYLHEDRNIVYVVVSGTNTYVHTSTTKFQRGTAYAYANMYSSGDSITSAALNAGVVSYGSV